MTCSPQVKIFEPKEWEAFLGSFHHRLHFLHSWRLRLLRPSVSYINFLLLLLLVNPPCDQRGLQSKGRNHPFFLEEYLF